MIDLPVFACYDKIKSKELFTMWEIILWHAGYFAAVFLFLVLRENVPPHVDDFQKMPRFIQALTKLFPPVGVLLVYGFCVMNCLLCTETMDEFIPRFIFQAIGATYISVMMIYWAYQNSLKSRLWVWLPPVLFFLYSLIKNIIVTDGFFHFLWREAISLFILFIGYVGTMWYDLDCTPSNYDKEAVRRELDERIAQEAEEEKRRQQESLYKPFDDTDSRRRRHGNESSDSFSDYVVNEYEKSRSIRNVSGQGSSRTCANCTYYDGSGCNNPNASAYQTTIWNASDHSCGQHRY